MSPKLCVILPALLLVLPGCSGGKKPEQPETRTQPVSTIEVRARVTKVLRSGVSVAIDAGRDRGIVVGTKFTIFRKGEMIGSLQVTTVLSKECGGTIIKSRKPVREDDEATAVVALASPGSGPRGGRTPAKAGNRPGVIRARLVAVKKVGGKVVLDAGSKQGVKLGKVFYVYRGDTYVGRVKVTLVRPAMSGAEIIEKRVVLGDDCRAVYDPEDERRDSGKQVVAPTDLDSMIKDLEIKIADPKTKEPDRKAAREVLLRLKKERSGKK